MSQWVSECLIPTCLPASCLLFVKAKEDRLRNFCHKNINNFSIDSASSPRDLLYVYDPRGFVKTKLYSHQNSDERLNVASIISRSSRPLPRNHPPRHLPTLRTRILCQSPFKSYSSPQQSIKKISLFFFSMFYFCCYSSHLNISGSSSSSFVMHSVSLI